MIIMLGFGDFDQTLTPKRGVINWGKYVSHSVEAAKKEGTIKCPYMKDVSDYPTYNLVTKDHCKSACMGEGCSCFNLCWGKAK